MSRITPITKPSVFQDISATISPENPLIVYIKFRSRKCGSVQVEYWNPQAGTFVTRATKITRRCKFVTIPVVRLRGSTTYEYRLLLKTTHHTYSSDIQSFTTGSLPDLLTSTVKFQMTGTFSSRGVTVLILTGATTGFFNGYVAVDQDGQVVWFYQQTDLTAVGDFQKMSDGNFLITRGNALGVPVDASPYPSRPQIISPLGELLVDSTPLCFVDTDKIGEKDATIAVWGDTHGAIQDPASPKTVKLLGLQLKDPFYNAGITPPGQRLQLGNTIREWIPANNKQRTIISLFDQLDPITYRAILSDSTDVSGSSCSYPNTGPDNQDWTHANGIARLDASSHYFVSLRDTSSVLILDPMTFKVIYKFGIAQPSDFAFVNPNDKFYNQHDAHELPAPAPDGNVLMFDDGTTRPLSEGGPYARAIEYALDFNTKTIRKVWEFRPQPDLPCQSVGSARRLENGNTVVDFGADNLSVKHVYEVTPTSSVVGDLQLSSEDTWYVFHAIPIDSINGEIRFL